MAIVSAAYLWARAKDVMTTDDGIPEVDTRDDRAGGRARDE
jgi:hypothetical protein